MEIVKYRYLREIINDNGNEATTIVRRIQKAAGVGAEITAVVRADKLQHKTVLEI